MRRTWRTLFALTMTFALVAGACGSDEEEEAAPAATTAAPTTAAPTTAAPAATTAAPDVGGLDEL
ncbi:MAG: branched-chain amino acid ABC transporter substrate-binding protein, partial [Actinomycetota bacterium]|nr:branched-chain amino acid ABC transporter substrate-binding protein [Actinomycetota bacterium]